MLFWFAFICSRECYHSIQAVCYFGSRSFVRGSVFRGCRSAGLSVISFLQLIHLRGGSHCTMARLCVTRKALIDDDGAWELSNELCCKVYAVQQRSSRVGFVQSL